MKIGLIANAISQITIDTAKDWNGQDITNLGDVKLANTKALLFPSLALIPYDANWITCKDNTLSNGRGLRGNMLGFYEYIIATNDAAYLAAKDTDSNYLMLKARDNGVGLVEVARLTGAADPTFDLLKGRLTGNLNGNDFSFEPMCALAGDELLYALDTNRSGNDLIYTMRKSIKVPHKGTYRVYFALANNQAGVSTYGRIYVDGVAVGVERSKLGVGTSYFSEDVAISTYGADIQLYAKAEAPATYTVAMFQISALYGYEPSFVADA